MSNRLADDLLGKTALLPITLSGEAAEVDGPVIDRKGFYGAAFGTLVGAVGGGGNPTNVELDVAIKHSSSSTGTFVTLSGESSAVEAVSTISGEASALLGKFDELNVNLDGAQRYIKYTVKPKFTGGTNPTIVVGAAVFLGEADTKPAA